MLNMISSFHSENTVMYSSIWPISNIAWKICTKIEIKISSSLFFFYHHLYFFTLQNIIHKQFHDFEYTLETTQNYSMTLFHHIYGRNNNKHFHWKFFYLICWKKFSSHQSFQNRHLWQNQIFLSLKIMLDEYRET